ncbi:MAG: HepT-like ribonuclease domain-containing protein [Leeuwenhoekiella sp.]
MENEIKTWLEDINQAIDEIVSFLPENRSYEEFLNDLKGKRAIERNLEIIGEAVSRILKRKPDIQINNARKIVDTRNRISHGYDTVSDDIIWSIVVQDLDKLKDEISQLLQ